MPVFEEMVYPSFSFLLFFLCFSLSEKQLKIKHFFQGRSAIDEDIDNFDWDTEDELGVQNLTVPSSSNIIVPSGSCSIGFAEVNFEKLSTAKNPPCLLISATFQGESTIDEDIDNFDWNTEDELRIQNLTLRSSSSIIVPRQSCTIGTREVNFAKTTACLLVSSNYCTYWKYIFVCFTLDYLFSFQ